MENLEEISWKLSNALRRIDQLEEEKRKLINKHEDKVFKLETRIR